MDLKTTAPKSTGLIAGLTGSVAASLGILLGVVMPALAAFIYPTFITHMGEPFYEWTRLQEVPFVFAELLARLQRLARRGSAAPSVETKLVCADLELDLLARRVKRGAMTVALQLTWAPQLLKPMAWLVKRLFHPSQLS